MTALMMLLMTTAAPGAVPVAQPPPASWAAPGDEGPRTAGSPRRSGRLRGLFGRRSQGPQPQPGSAWGAPIAAGPITPPVLSQGPQPQPGCACGAPPGGAVRPVP